MEHTHKESNAAALYPKLFCNGERRPSETRPWRFPGGGGVSCTSIIRHFVRAFTLASMSLSVGDATGSVWTPGRGALTTRGEGKVATCHATLANKIFFRTTSFFAVALATSKSGATFILVSNNLRAKSARKGFFYLGKKRLSIRCLEEVLRFGV